MDPKTRAKWSQLDRKGQRLYDPPRTRSLKQSNSQRQAVDWGSPETGAGGGDLVFKGHGVSVRHNEEVLEMRGDDSYTQCECT